MSFPAAHLSMCLILHCNYTSRSRPSVVSTPVQSDIPGCKRRWSSCRRGKKTMKTLSSLAVNTRQN